MGLYYDKMTFYMERALFGLTVLGMNHPEDSVVMQAVEFWSTVAEEEYELSVEASEVGKLRCVSPHIAELYSGPAIW